MNKKVIQRDQPAVSPGKDITGYQPVRPFYIQIMRKIKISTAIINEQTSSVKRYLSEIGRIGLLRPEEEAELAKRIRRGDHAATHRLIASNLRFVVSVAKKYQNYGLPLADLISEGNIGLLKAAQCFDDTKGFKFISYAVWWIRQSILGAIAEQASLVRLPRNQIHALTKINRLSSELEGRLQRQPTADELAEHMNVDVAKLTDTRRHAAWAVSCDAPVPDTDNCTLMQALLAQEFTIEDEFIAEAEARAVRGMLVVLTPAEREIIELTFGIGHDREMSAPETAQKMQMSTANVRFIRKRAIAKLQFLLKAKKLGYALNASQPLLK